jgi:uncharacterized membrane protein
MLIPILMLILVCSGGNFWLDRLTSEASLNKTDRVRLYKILASCRARVMNDKIHDG